MPLPLAAGGPAEMPCVWTLGGHDAACTWRCGALACCPVLPLLRPHAASPRPRPAISAIPAAAVSFPVSLIVITRSPVRALRAFRQLPEGASASAQDFGDQTHEPLACLAGADCCDSIGSVADGPGLTGC